MDVEEFRSGSTDSENGSDNSYVQVNREDVPASESQQLDVDDVSLLSAENSGTPAIGDEEDIYGDDSTEQVESDGETLETQTKAVISDTASSDKFIESKEELPPPAIESQLMETKLTETKPSEVPSGVQEVVPTSVITEPKKSSSTPSPPMAKGYLSFLNTLHPFMLYLIYWQDLRLSAVVLGVILVLLLTLTLNTVLHTTILFLNSFLVVSLIYIVIRIVVDSFYNREVMNPFNSYLNKKISLPEEEILDWTRYIVKKADKYFNRLVRLLLFDNIKQSLKFGFFLWLAAFFTNCCTLLFSVSIAVIVLFSVPPLYERFQVGIDANLKMAVQVTKDTFINVKSMIPYLGKSKAD